MTDRRLARQARLREVLALEGADAMLVSHLPNIRWLTGFTGSAGMVLLTPTHTLLLTDFRYAVQAPQESGTAAEVIVERASLWERLKRELERRGPEQLLFESHVVTVRDAERLEATARGRLRPAGDLVEQLRQVKDADEVAALRDAAALAHEALAEVLPQVRVGDRELDVAARLESALRRRGSEWHPFQTIVASGPRSALPHAGTSERPIGRGEFLLIDFGAIVGGYCADITRTVVVGAEPDERQRRIYGLVEAAQQRARTAIRAGMTGRDADALARAGIAEAGYGDAFGHSLGHGIGLEVHEAPRLAATAEGVLPVGAVVTIEPGIYLPGWGGVRLEDDVWLSPDGPVLLSDGRTDLITI
jgi:Xaa-Pro aminopeptidase